MATINSTTNNNEDQIIEQSKQKMRLLLNNFLTPDVRDSCPGIAIVMLSLDEYNKVIELLEEGSIFKKRLALTGQRVKHDNNNIYHPVSLHLNVVRDT